MPMRFSIATLTAIALLLCVSTVFADSYTVYRSSAVMGDGSGGETLTTETHRVRRGVFGSRHHVRVLQHHRVSPNLTGVSSMLIQAGPVMQFQQVPVQVQVCPTCGRPL